MKGSVRVFCRFRPLAKREEDLGDIPVLHKAESELGQLPSNQLTIYVPVVPHKAVTEVSKIGNL